MNNISCSNRGFPKGLAEAKEKNHSQWAWKQSYKETNEVVTQFCFLGYPCGRFTLPQQQELLASIARGLRLE